MILTGRTALVTGAGQGLGLALVHELLARGVSRVYAADIRLLQPAALRIEARGRITSIVLDVRSVDAVTEAAARYQDVDLLVNSAGVNKLTGLLSAGGLEAARHELDVNCLGMLSMCQAFAPSLKSRPDAAIVNILSALIFGPIQELGSYCVSKAAAGAMTELLRRELAGQGIKVLGAYPGAIDTPMLETLQIHKITAEEAAGTIVDALEAGKSSVLVGQEAINLHRRYRDDSQAKNL